MRTIKEEEVNLSEYEDFADAYGQLGRFLNDVYNLKQSHSSLGNLTPGVVRGALAAGAESHCPTWNRKRHR